MLKNFLEAGTKALVALTAIALIGLLVGIVSGHVWSGVFWAAFLGTAIATMAFMGWAMKSIGGPSL